MAIQKYVEDGKEYFKVYVHVRSKSGARVQRYSNKLKTEAEARREERKLLQDASREAQKLDGLGLTWRDITHLWWQDIKAGHMGMLTERSAEGYLSIINKWTSPWMDKAASTLTRSDGRELIIRMEREGLTRTYQKKIKNIINSVFEWGVEFKFINGNPDAPLVGLMIAKTDERPPDILTLEDIKTFLRTAKTVEHRWYPIWAFAILTGMRSGELHALTWNQIDLEKGTILVDRSYDSNAKKSGPTKGRYWRTVPINSSLRKLIIELKGIPELSNSEFVLPRIKDWDNGDQAVPIRNFLNSIKIRPVKFHTLRACFATQMLANGVSAPIVMKIGGWKKSSTMDIYLRLAGVDTKGATECLGFVPDDLSFSDNVVNLFPNG